MLYNRVRLTVTIAKQPTISTLLLLNVTVPSQISQHPVPDWKYKLQLFFFTLSKTNFNPFPLFSGVRPEICSVKATFTASSSVFTLYTTSRYFFIHT